MEEKDRKVRVFDVMQDGQKQGYSLVVTDCDGKIREATKERLLAEGYEIRCLDFADPKAGGHYNPLSYIRSDRDILHLTWMIVEAAGGHTRNGDPFWIQEEKLLLSALIAYLHNYTKEESQTIDNILRLLRASETEEWNKDEKSALDYLFEEVEENTKDEGSFAVNQYKSYHLAAAGTRRGIVASCITVLENANLSDYAELTNTDDIHLDELGQKKIALFIEQAGDHVFDQLEELLHLQLSALLGKQESRDKTEAEAILDIDRAS